MINHSGRKVTTGERERRREKAVNSGHLALPSQHGQTRKQGHPLAQAKHFIKIDQSICLWIDYLHSYESFSMAHLFRDLNTFIALFLT
jgi:hypothetical protein